MGCAGSSMPPTHASDNGAGATKNTDVVLTLSPPSEDPKWALRQHFGQVFWLHRADRRLPRTTIDSLTNHFISQAVREADIPTTPRECKAYAQAAGLSSAEVDTVVEWNEALTADESIKRLPERPSLDDSEYVDEPASGLSMSLSMKRRGGAAVEITTRDFRQPQPLRRFKSAGHVVLVTLPSTRSSSSVSSSYREDRTASVNKVGKPTGVRHVSHQASFHARATLGEGTSACFTHEGGGGGVGKENQDALFTAAPCDGVCIYGVFDGHGKAHGKRAAAAAAAAVEAELSREPEQLRSSPVKVLHAAFAAGHEAVRQAMLAQPRTRAVGMHVIEWLTDEGVWDAAEGGTTATVAILLDGTTLIVGAVGDSSAMLLGRTSGGEPRSELLVEEHSPTSLAEYERMQRLSSARALRFVYDCPDDILIDIFTTMMPPTLDADAAQRADKDHQCAVKNARGELVSVLIVPEGVVLLAEGMAEGAVPDAAAGMAGGEDAADEATIEEHSIAMTRSLGDFYAHHVGIISEPEVRTIELDAFLTARDWASCSLLLASDGVWDMWRFEEVAEMLVPLTARPLLSNAASFCEATRAKGDDFFGESADNLTGVLVELRGPSAAASGP